MVQVAKEVESETARLSVKVRGEIRRQPWKGRELRASNANQSGRSPRAAAEGPKLMYPAQAAQVPVNGFQRQPHSSERGLFMASPWSRDSATSSVNRHSYSPTRVESCHRSNRRRPGRYPSRPPTSNQPSSHQR